MVRIVEWSAEKPQSKYVTKFLARSAFPEEAEKAAAEVLAAIRAEGDRAVARYVAKFEGAKLTPKRFRVTEDELAAAEAQVPPALRRAVKDAYTRVMRFSKASLKAPWTMKTPKGGTAGEFYSPMDRVGVYVPGGTAPLASTSVMTVTLAKAAGVKEIVACTPAGKDGKVNPVLLFALKFAGATEVYRVGGIQAIGLLAFGTKTCRKVQKIAGPGNAFVTAAKRQVYGYVAIDQVAGPSEIAVLTDGSVDVRWIAADLLSQAEHGVDSQAILLTTSERLVERVQEAITRQVEQLPRKEITEKALAHSRIILLKNQEEVMAFTNRYAPEHLIIQTQNYAELAAQVENAGSVFLGPYTPESAGDYASGTNHTLPTNGYAKAYSGVNLDSFIKKITFQEITREGIQSLGPTIQTMAAGEQLDAHKQAVTIRLTEK